MATSHAGPASFCARETNTCHYGNKENMCEACALNRPQDCIAPYRPGKTQGIRVRGIRKTFRVTVPQR